MILKSPEGREYGLQVGENLIGRSADCWVRVEAPRVSRRHAVIEWDGQRGRIMDLGSTNGTVVNGRRLEPNRYYPFNAGDKVDFGAGIFAATADVLPADAASVGAPRGAPEAPPLIPVSMPLPAPPAPPARKRSWPLIAGLAALLLVVFAAAVWWGLSRTRTEEAAEKIEPAAAVVSVAEATSTPQPLPATATLAPSKAAPAKSQPQAAPAAPRVALPPINATTMPNVMQQFMGGVDPNLLASMLGGTPVPGLSDMLGGGTPGAAGGPRGGRYPAPRLIAPATGSGFSGQDAVVVLEWEPTQGLRANDYYWVMVFYKRGDREEAGGAWMKGTSYRVPAWFLSQAQGRFEWQVVIAEASGLAEQGGKLRGAVSEPSERRWFQWDASTPAQPPAPAPNPGDSPLPTPTYGG